MAGFSTFCMFAVAGALCVLHMESSNAATVTVQNPSAVANSVPQENKTSGNSTAQIPKTVLRAKRQACSNQEHWTHKCRNDCECSRQRYCSTYGWCHARSRDRRQDDNDDDLEQDGVNYQDDQDDEW